MVNEDKFILVSLDDSKSKSIAEVIGNSTCKKIINYLDENKEASQKDLSDALKLPLNTIDYNIKKLLDSGFIQKKKNFFWSKKGKKILMYELSNKSIVFSPKKNDIEKFKSIIPAIILIGALTFGIFVFEKINEAGKKTVSYVEDSSALFLEKASGGANNFVSFAPQISEGLLNSKFNYGWAWFLGGAILAILILSILNWRKL